LFQNQNKKSRQNQGGEEKRIWKAGGFRIQRGGESLKEKRGVTGERKEVLSS